MTKSRPIPKWRHFLQFCKKCDMFTPTLCLTRHHYTLSEYLVILNDSGKRVRKQAAFFNPRNGWLDMYSVKITTSLQDF